LSKTTKGVQLLLQIQEKEKLFLRLLRRSRQLPDSMMMFDAEAPTQVFLRAAKVYIIIYDFADASGSGFGSTVLLGGSIHYRIGTCGSDSEDNSSNFQEFKNVVDTLCEEAKRGALKDALIILCTDNSTAESAFAKGNSSSKTLFNAGSKCERELAS
jgi:hypothetical protein